MEFQARRQMKSNTRVKFAAAVIVIGLSIPAIAGARILVNIPNIPGEVVDTAFQNQIEATSISFGYSSPVNLAIGKQESLFVAPVTITKAVDKSSTKLMETGGQGKRLASVVVSNVVDGGTNTTMTVTLKDVAITDFQIIASQNTTPFEQITFLPSNVTVEYTQIGPTGAPGSKFSGTFSAK